MPLEVYRRGRFWWARGYVEDNGQRITDYYRCSTGSSSEAGARDWCRAEEDRQRRRHLLGESAVLTFADAVSMYTPKPAEAAYLMKVLPELGHMPVASITPKMVRNLGPKLYPSAATDTWFRQIVTPVRAVINNAHDLGQCAPIKIKGYSEIERIAQDQVRGKRSRGERKPFSRAWVEAFCAHADAYNAALVRFIFETGARIDQAISLTADDLDLMNRRVWIKAQKGHPDQWVTITQEMVVELANLPPKRPHDRKNNRRLPARVFGYASKGGYRAAWATICDKAGIERLTAHSGRHGFYTELRVRRNVDPITAAKAGRWKNPSLPDANYAHAETEQAEIRALFRTDQVQTLGTDAAKGLKNGR